MADNKAYEEARKKTIARNDAKNASEKDLFKKIELFQRTLGVLDQKSKDLLLGARTYEQAEQVLKPYNIKSVKEVFDAKPYWLAKNEITPEKDEQLPQEPKKPNKGPDLKGTAASLGMLGLTVKEGLEGKDYEKFVEDTLKEADAAAKRWGQNPDTSYARSVDGARTRAINEAYDALLVENPELATKWGNKYNDQYLRKAFNKKAVLDKPNPRRDEKASKDKVPEENPTGELDETLPDKTPEKPATSTPKKREQKKISPEEKERREREIEEKKQLDQRNEEIYKRQGEFHEEARVQLRDELTKSYREVEQEVYEEERQRRGNQWASKIISDPKRTMYGPDGRIIETDIDIKINQRFKEKHGVKWFKGSRGDRTTGRGAIAAGPDLYGDIVVQRARELHPTDYPELISEKTKPSTSVQSNDKSSTDAKVDEIAEKLRSSGIEVDASSMESIRKMAEMGIEPIAGGAAVPTDYNEYQQPGQILPTRVSETPTAKASKPNQPLTNKNLSRTKTPRVDALFPRRVGRGRRSFFDPAKIITRLIRRSGITSLISAATSAMGSIFSTAFTGIATAIGITIGAIAAISSIGGVGVAVAAAKITAVVVIVAVAAIVITTFVSGSCRIPVLSNILSVFGVCESSIESNAPPLPEGFEFSMLGPLQVDPNVNIEYKFDISFDPQVVDIADYNFYVVTTFDHTKVFVSGDGVPKTSSSETEYYVWDLSENQTSQDDTDFTLQLIVAPPKDAKLSAVIIPYIAKVYKELEIIVSHDEETLPGGGGGGGDPSDLYFGIGSLPTNNKCPTPNKPEGKYAKVNRDNKKFIEDLNALKSGNPYTKMSGTGYNYGDPVCTYTAAKWTKVLHDVEKNEKKWEFWEDISKCEGGVNSIGKKPSDIRNVVFEGKTYKFPFGPYGSLQTNRGRPPIAKKPNRDDPRRGDVTWQQQIINAVKLNNNEIKAGRTNFGPWGVAYCFCAFNYYSRVNAWCGDIKANDLVRTNCNNSCITNTVSSK